MSALQELSTQLLVHIQPSGPGAQPPGGPAAPPSGPGERLEAQEKVHVIWNRLKLLLREVNVDLEELERRLEEAGQGKQVRGLSRACVSLWFQS